MNRHFELGERLECDSCGRPVTSVATCPWDSRLQVGECCMVHDDELRCAQERGLIVMARSVSEINQAVAEHRATCPKCQAEIREMEAWNAAKREVIKKGPGRAGELLRGRRAA